VVVKEGVTRASAELLHPEVARQQIREAAERAMKLDSAPFGPVAPITLRVVFERAIHADMAALVPGSGRVNGRTVEWTGEDMPAVYRVFVAMASLSFLG